MRLCSLGIRSRSLPSDHGLQSAPKGGQRAEPLDAPQAGFDVLQGGSQPPLLLLGGPPAIDLGGPLLNQGIQRFEAVRRLQTHAQLQEDAQAVEGERFLQPFVQALHRGLVHEPEILPHPEEGGLRLGVGRLLVRRLELPAPGGPLSLGQVVEDILALMPLAALDHCLGTEHGLEGLPEALGPVDHAEEALGGLQPALHQLTEEGGADRVVLGGGLDEAEDDLLAGQGDPEGDHLAP